MAKATAEKFNVYDYVTQTIIAAIEAGTGPWEKSWTGAVQQLGMPLRANGEAYRGINVLMLWVEAHLKGHRSAYWMTYKQAQELGGQVRKGEKSATVVKYGTFEVDRENASADSDPEKRAYARAYRVFNADQIDGLPSRFHEHAQPPRDLGTQSDPMVQAWFDRLGIAIDTTDEPAAYYTPATDRVHMPPIGTFQSAGKYFGTLAHECAHATKAGHRLNRQHAGLSHERYAREEVVAELAAAMVATRLGIQTEYDQNAAYLAHWIGVMKEDNRAIVKAASQAQAACDWMFAQAGELDQPHPAQIAA